MLSFGGAQRRIALIPEQSKENIQYFISYSGYRTHNLAFKVTRLCPRATPDLVHRFIVFNLKLMKVYFSL